MASPMLKNFATGIEAAVGVAVSKATREQPEEANPTPSGGFVQANLSATVTRVPHGLGRVPTGWAIVDCVGPTLAYRSGAMTDTYVPLAASSAQAVTVWIF